VRAAASSFLAALSPEQRAKTLFAVDDPEWRQMDEPALLRAPGNGLQGHDGCAARGWPLACCAASLSARGLQLSRDIMHLNQTLAELTNNFTEYGEGLYWLTVMGTPSKDEPWGWQLGGHHLIINYS
jgi:hypothetical protein